MLRLESVSFARGERLVLDEVGLTVNAGELVVVHGGRACGKSTLASIAAARLASPRGAVWIGERNVAGLQRASLPFVRRNVGFLSALLPLLEEETALENVMLAGAVRGLSVVASEEEAHAALAAVAPAERGGFDGQRPIATLSASERHLVALARAICGAPPLLVLDDLGGGVAGAEDRERVVAAAAAECDRGAAVLATTSDEGIVVALVERGGRRVKLEDGRLTGGLPAMSLVVDRDERTRGYRDRGKNDGALAAVSGTLGDAVQAGRARRGGP